MGANKTYIGIDIGLKGAIAVMQKDHDQIQVYPMPVIKGSLDTQGVYDILKPFGGSPCFVAFERLGVIFGSSKVTAFSMGHQTGLIEAFCIALNIPYLKVPAKEWQRIMFMGVDELTKAASKNSKTGKPIRDTKAMALVAIKRRFPGLKLTYGDVAKKPHDGLIDSVLIAQYAMQNNL